MVEIKGSKFVFEYYAVEENNTLTISPCVIYEYNSFKKRNHYLSGEIKTKHTVGLGNELIFSFINTSGGETKMAQGVYYYDHVQDDLANLNCHYSPNDLFDENSYNDVFDCDCLEALDARLDSSMEE